MKFFSAFGLSVVLFLIGGSLNVTAQPPAQPAENPPLSATFIQYFNGVENWQSIEDWKREISTMKAAGIHSIVLQYMGHEAAKIYEGKFNLMNEVLLNYADDNGMSVYLGLWFGDEFWEAAKTINPAYFNVDTNPQNNGEWVKQTIAILPKLRNYTNHRSFKGWYIPQEFWNQDYTPDQQNRLKACLKKVCELAKGTHAGRVLISPFFTPTSEYATVEKTAAEFNNIFTGTGITDVLVHDGVGTKKWDSESEIRAYVPLFFQAYKAAAHHAGAKFWCNIESFDETSGSRIPAKFDRLKRQVEIEKSFADLDENQRRQIITFDFYHYMSPVHAGESLAQRTELFNAYVQAYPNR